MLDVILMALKVEDYELGNWAKNELQVRYGKVAADCIVKAVTLKEEQASKEVIKQLIQKDILDIEETANLILKIKEVRKKDRFSISDIMDMYHSENDFLVRKSKEYIVINYGRYVHNIVHKVYPTYAEKYEEELYHSGLMGLIIAMKGYSVEKGAFTTYSKMFIRHEINSQINFHNNDSTVHYNGVQKKISDAIAQIYDAGYEPSIERIAIMSEIKPEIVKRELDYIERTKFVYLDDGEEEKDEISDYNSSPEHIMLENEKAICIRKCIDSLPETVKQVVILRYQTDFNNEEIAKRLGLTVGQVRNHYQKGLELLRKDSRMCESFGDYMSEADKELAKYNIPVIPTEQEIEQNMAELLTVMSESFD